MTFNNVFFIFLFLPVVLFFNFIIKNKILKNLFLVLFSFLFYAWGNPSTLVLLILYILFNYFTGLEIDNSEGKQRTITFVIGISVQVLVLFLYKYIKLLFPFLSVELNVPVGLSFFTFSCLSYLIDVYTKKSRAQSNLLHLSLYISFFGKISMGPIVQYNQMEKELEHHPFQIQLFCDGIKLFCIGLCKKAILADSLSIVHTNLSASSSVLGSWLFAISYMLQIYFDFSGYSDMAIGIANMFGFHFNKNFDHPYNALSIQDFWRRWHISLSRWFRDYIYIPLGGNRVSNGKYIRNIFVVWFLTGLWHGANWTFIIWGLYFGCLLLLEKYVLKDLLEKCPRFICHIYTWILVLISWVFFMSPNLTQAFGVLGKMIGINASLYDMNALFYLRSSVVLILIGIVFSFPVYEKLESYVLGRWKQKASIALTIVYVVVFLISISYVISNTFQSFLYFAF
ncbi:MAG: MBOAT family protein [Floccifex porci]|uniref:MBOAT family protein n=1 Tax=Floccifex porci TaxID=2606629 RepID=A0A7X2N2M9_9FIRM|nr:MBOAT family O-acyltransferase [Floccifex porci]MCI7802829.1 MBOAT family protein [Erysipelotrichaceae bacterium]MDD7466889.1 MBOAT family protein [Floccifex porci]MSS01312.1 MBOAT family protein [Floccifex porci]